MEVRVAFDTGTTSGIGEATAVAFAEHGVHVASRAGTVSRRALGGGADRFAW